MAIVVVVVGGNVVVVVGGRVVVVVEVVVVGATVLDVVVASASFLASAWGAVLQAAVRMPTATIPTDFRLNTPGPHLRSR